MAPTTSPKAPRKATTANGTPRTVATATVPTPAPHANAVCPGTGTCWCNTPVAPAVPLLPPPLAQQAAPQAPQGPATPAPAPQGPQGRTKARMALLVAVWVLVAVCTVLAGAGRLYARLPLLVASGATKAAAHLRTYARTL